MEDLEVWVLFEQRPEESGDSEQRIQEVLYFKWGKYLNLQLKALRYTHTAHSCTQLPTYISCG